MSAVVSSERYRTFWPRVIAAIIDDVVLLPLAWILDPDSYGTKAPPAIVFLNTLGYVLPILYSVLLHARYGQTLGKMVVGVIVMNVDESRIPTLGQALLRDIGEIAFNIAALAYLFGLVAAGQYTMGDEYRSSFFDVLGWAGFAWGLLEIVTMLTNGKRRAVHDFIAGTVVVRKTS